MPLSTLPVFPIDGASGVPSLRTLGYGAQQAARGGSLASLNIEDFGGKGDYLTSGIPANPTKNDDALIAAMQAADAMAAATSPAAVTGGGDNEIYFPPGFYYFSKTVKLNRRIRILGVPGAVRWYIEQGTHGQVGVSVMLGQQFNAQSLSRTSGVVTVVFGPQHSGGTHITHAWKYHNRAYVQLSDDIGHILTEGSRLYVYNSRDSTTFPEGTKVIHIEDAANHIFSHNEPGADVGGPSTVAAGTAFLSGIGDNGHPFTHEVYVGTSGNSTYITEGRYKISSYTGHSITFTTPDRTSPANDFNRSPPGSGFYFFLGYSNPYVRGIDILAANSGAYGGTRYRDRHGVFINGPCVFEDCNVFYFPGNAWHISASSPAGFGIADSWRLLHCTGAFCGAHGIFNQGNDTSAGYADQFSAFDNKGYLVYDASFLANTYNAPHLRAGNEGFMSGGLVVPPGPSILSYQRKNDVVTIGIDNPVGGFSALRAGQAAIDVTANQIHVFNKNYAPIYSVSRSGGRTYIILSVAVGPGTNWTNGGTAYVHVGHRDFAAGLKTIRIENGYTFSYADAGTPDYPATQFPSASTFVNESAISILNGRKGNHGLYQPMNGSITVLAQGSMTEGAVYEIHDGVSLRTFEIDKVGDGVSPGHVQVDISRSTTAADVAAALTAAINGSGSAIEAWATGTGFINLYSVATPRDARAIWTNQAGSTVAGMSDGDFWLPAPGYLRYTEPQFKVLYARRRGNVTRLEIQILMEHNIELSLGGLHLPLPAGYKFKLASTDETQFPSGEYVIKNTHDVTTVLSDDRRERLIVGNAWIEYDDPRGDVARTNSVALSTVGHPDIDYVANPGWMDIAGGSIYATGADNNSVFTGSYVEDQDQAAIEGPAPAMYLGGVGASRESPIVSTSIHCANSTARYNTQKVVALPPADGTAAFDVAQMTGPNSSGVFYSKRAGMDSPRGVAFQSPGQYGGYNDSGSFYESFIASGADPLRPAGWWGMYDAGSSLYPYAYSSRLAAVGPGIFAAPGGAFIGPPGGTGAYRFWPNVGNEVGPFNIQSETWFWIKAGSAYTDVADGMTVTINDGVTGADVVFEFDTNGVVTSGHVAVDISRAASKATVMQPLNDAINVARQQHKLNLVAGYSTRNEAHDASSILGISHYDVPLASTKVLYDTSVFEGYPDLLDGNRLRKADLQAQRGDIMINTQANPGVASGWIFSQSNKWEPFSYINANARDVAVSNVSPGTTVATLIPVHHNGNTTDNFEVKVYYRVTTAPTNITIILSWEDSSGVQTLSVVPLTLKGIGSYTASSIYVNARSSSPITLTALSGAAGQLYVSATIQPVS